MKDRYWTSNVGVENVCLPMVAHGEDKARFHIVL